MKQFADMPEGMVIESVPEPAAPAPAFADLPEGMVIETVPEPTAPEPAFADMPEGMVIESVPEPTVGTPTTPYWKRMARTAGAGLVNFAANTVGSTLFSKPETQQDKEDFGSLFSNDAVPHGDVYIPTRTPEEAKATRETVRALAPDVWTKTFEAETQKEIPSPMKDPLGFLSAAVMQSAANLGNVGSALIGKTAPGIALAALNMADQEAGSFADNWSKDTGLPLDFVTPYAKAYGMLAAPVEYAQSAAYGGNKVAGKLLAKVPGANQIMKLPGRAASRVATSLAGRALLKAMGIAVEGLEGGAEEVTQGWIEHKIAEKMAKEWNAKNPEKSISIPAFTSEQAWQNFKAGGGMGIVFGSVRGARDGAVRIVTDRAANARSAAAAERVAERIPLDAAAEARSAAAEARAAENAKNAPPAPQVTEGTKTGPVTDLGAGVTLPAGEPVETGPTVPGYIPGAGKAKGRSGTKATPVQKAYDRDTPAGDFPLIDLVVRQNGIRKPANMGENYGGPEGRDVAQLLYNPEGSVTPDEAARMARDQGLIPDGYEDEFWNRLSDEVDQYRKMREAGHKSLAEYGAAQQLEHEEDQWKLKSNQAERWAAGTREQTGRTAVPAGELRAGDALIVDGRRVDVNGVDEESGDVVLSDAGLGGFGTQSVKLDDVIHVDRVLQDGFEEDTGARANRFAQDVAPGSRPVSVPTGTLGVGDRVQVGPSVLTVRGVNADSGAVELDDLGGMRIYGRQTVPSGGTLAVDAVTKAEAPADEEAPFLKRTTTAGMGAGGTRESAGTPPPTPSGARIDRIAADGQAANDPRFSRLPLRLHHLVTLAKQLGATVRLSKGRGDWLGRFKAVDAGPAGVTKEILLRHNLFELVPAARQAEMRAEAKTEAAAKFGGGDPAAATALEEQLFQEKVQREKTAALEKGTPEATAVMAHEVGHLVDYAPDRTLKRGNLLGHLAALKGYMKNMLQERPTAEKLIPPAVRRIIDRDARQASGKRPQAEGPEMEAWKQRRQKNYQAGMRREAARRGLITLEQIDEESQGLIAWWNGTAEMPGYFKSASERYAEVFSVLANNPAAVAARAPAFWRAWNNFLKARPDAAKVYDQMQEDIATGADMDKARAEFRSGLEKTVEIDRTADERQKRSDRRTRWDAMAYYAFRAQAPIDWQLIKADQAALKAAGMGPLRRLAAAGSSAIAQAAEAAGTATLRAALGNFRYASTLAELYQHDMRNKVLEPMWAAGVSEVDFAEYMAMRHIVEDRPDIASTGGVDPAEAKRRLKIIEKENPDVFAAMKTGADRWFSVRAKHVHAALERENMLTPELKDTLRKREAYVTFMPIFQVAGENDPAGLVADLAKRYGSGVTEHIGFQKGWLGEIKDPIAATMQKDRKIILAIQRNAAARELGKFLLKQQAENPAGPPLIAEADKEWRGEKMGTRMLRESNPNLGDLIWLEGGEAKHYYVPRAYSEFLNGMHPNQFFRIVTAINAFLTVPMKRALVDWNPGAWPWLAAKDFRSFMTQTPGVNPVQKLTGLGKSIQAARSISAGVPNELARKTMERGVILSRQQNVGYDAQESAQQREVNMFGRLRRSEAETENERFHAIRQLGRAYADFADKINKTASATWKIQAMQLLNKHNPNMPDWQKAEMVREIAGNPDFLHRAAASSMLDWVQLYYNAAKEGRMAALKAFRNHPRDYAVNMAMWTAGPSLLLGAAAMGMVSKAIGHLLRPEELENLKEFEEMMKWIPSYERLRNHCFPLGWADKKMKRVYFLRLPISEGEMIVHGAITGAMSKDVDPKSVLYTTIMASGMNMNPGNPVYNVAKAWSDYYLERRNPYDSYRGSLMMTDTEFSAGGRYAVYRLGKFTYDNFVGSLLGRLPYSQSPYAPEKKGFEKTLQFPVIASTLGKWVRVSSGFDEEAKLVADKVNQVDARARLEVQGMVRDFMAGKAPAPEEMARIMGDPRRARYTKNYWEELNLRQNTPPDIRSIMDAPNDQIRMELLKRRGFKGQP